MIALILTVIEKLLCSLFLLFLLFKKTDEPNCLILTFSMFLSNEEASEVLKLLGVTVNNDSIKRLTDKIIIEDNKNVEAIGINDIAIGKGQTYATAIYDMEDHHLIALLDGRDKETVKF